MNSKVSFVEFLLNSGQILAHAEIFIVTEIHHKITHCVIYIKNKINIVK